MKKLSKNKKIALIIIASLALLVVGYLAFTALFMNSEHGRFMSLDSSQKELYNKLSKASEGADNTDNWTYRAGCTEVYSGALPTGQFDCSTTISMSKSIGSVDELNSAQSKYFNIIDQDTNLKQVSELNIQTPDDFGKKFVVSSAEKHYTDTISGVSCRYIIALEQLGETTSNFEYGTPIKNTGKINISISCSGKSNSSWYQIQN